MPTLHDLLVMKDIKIQVVKIKLVRRIELSIFRKNKIIEQNCTRDRKKMIFISKLISFPRGEGAFNVIFVTYMHSTINFGYQVLDLYFPHPIII
jgi:hypothetical protein